MKRVAVVSGIALAVFLCTGPAQAVSLSASPSVSSVKEGDTFDVVIGVSGAVSNNAPSVGAYDLNFNFDSSLLSLLNISFGNQLDIFGLGSIQSSSVFSGDLNVYEISLDSASDLDSQQVDGFSLFSIQFLAINDGTSPLSLTLNYLSDSMGDSLVPDISSGSITIDPAISGGNPPTEVPEPVTMALFGLTVPFLTSLKKKTERRR